MNTLTSKKARSDLLPQNPFAAISSLAPSSAIAVAFESTSPVIGCRVGSNADIMTDFSHQVGSEISVLIVANSREAALRAGECMFHREIGSTGFSHCMHCSFNPTGTKL